MNVTQHGDAGPGSRPGASGDRGGALALRPLVCRRRHGLRPGPGSRLQRPAPAPPPSPDIMLFVPHTLSTSIMTIPSITKNSEHISVIRDVKYHVINSKQLLVSMKIYFGGSRLFLLLVFNLFIRARSWTSSGSTHVELVENLRRDGRFSDQRVYNALLKVSRVILSNCIMVHLNILTPVYRSPRPTASG